VACLHPTRRQIQVSSDLNRSEVLTEELVRDRTALDEPVIMSGGMG
jgi:hypothetical protein